LRPRQPRLIPQPELTEALRKVSDASFFDPRVKFRLVCEMRHPVKHSSAASLPDISRHFPFALLPATVAGNGEA
jgi:hypothetical protein